jgi:energy-coupling factor transport system permease protein
MTWQSIGDSDKSALGLDFRSKLAVMITVTLLSFLWEGLAYTGGLALVVGLLCLLAGVPLSFLLRVLRTMLPFYVFLLLLHGFGNTYVGRTALWTAPANWWLVGGHLRLTSEGLRYGAMIAFRTLNLVWILALVILTTDLNTMIVGLVALGVPFSVAFVFSATLRFVPLLLTEVQLIIEAQRLRGLAVEEMGVLRRLAVYSRIGVPLILGALVRSQQVQIALAARAFSGSPQRTHLHESTPTKSGQVIVIACALMLVGATWLRITRGVGGPG